MVTYFFLKTFSRQRTTHIWYFTETFGIQTSKYKNYHGEFLFFVLWVWLSTFEKYLVMLKWFCNNFACQQHRSRCLIWCIYSENACGNLSVHFLSQNKTAELILPFNKKRTHRWKQTKTSNQQQGTLNTILHSGYCWK